MVCKEYAHCTWTYYRTQMPEEEKLFWRHFMENEWKRAEMRKTDVYKKYREITEGVPLLAVEDAPVVPTPPLHIEES